MFITTSLLFACQSPRIDAANTTAIEPTPADTGTPADTEPPAPTETGDTAGDDTAPPADTDPPEVSEETIEDHVLDDSWLFSDAAIHHIELTLSSESWNNLTWNPYDYTEASVSINGETLDTVGVRLRGKYGSFRDLNGKPKFKIDFNQYVEDQRFYGLETLSLNNEIVDCSYLKEPIGYALFEELAVPTSRTGFATLSVNGAPYGLFVLIEVPDDRFLKRAYDDSSGNLYDGKYIMDEDWNFISFLDFNDRVDTLFQLEEGTDVAHADIIAVSNALRSAPVSGDFYSEMAAVVDWDNLHTVWAVEQWLGQNDGYVLNTNNYRVYFNPADGLASMIPWDLDYTFLYDYEWGMDWGRPAGNLTSACWRDADCLAAQQAAMAEVLDAVESAELLARFTDMQALIADAADDDPRRECSGFSVDSEQAFVQSWLKRRSNEMREAWGL